MHEHFHFKPGFFHLPNILFRAFACEHHARIAQLFGDKRALIVVYAHLRAGMQGHAAFAEYAQSAHICDDKGVRARFRRRLNVLFQRYEFVLLYASVKSNIDLYPVKVAKVYMFFYIFYGEILRFCTRVEHIQPQIYGVGAVIDRRL